MQQQFSGIVPDPVVFRSVIAAPVQAEMESIWTDLIASQSSSSSSSSSSITAQSFRNAVGTLAEWGPVLSQFDEDQSGTIEQLEFLNGFKKWLLLEALPIPANCHSLREVLAAVDATANDKLAAKVAEFKAHLAKSASS